MKTFLTPTVAKSSSKTTEAMRKIIPIGEYQITTKTTFKIASLIPSKNLIRSL